MGRNTQFIATGNNLRLSSDTCRRVLLARLDAEMETPYTRDFAFDPAQHVERHRLALVADALTIIRAHIASGRPKVAAGRTASFELWDDLIRQPICWLAQHVERHNAEHPAEPLPTFSDPMQAAARSFEADPETQKHGALLEAWHAVFFDMPTTVASAIKKATGIGGPESLLSALEEIGGQGGKVNSRIVGRWVERMQGRRIAGKFFVKGGLRDGVMRWSVKWSRDSGRNKPTTSTEPTESAPEQSGKWSRDSGQHKPTTSTKPTESAPEQSGKWSRDSGQHKHTTSTKPTESAHSGSPERSESSGLSVLSGFVSGRGADPHPVSGQASDPDEVDL